MFPQLRGRTMPARYFRVYFWLFAVRHAMGIALVTWVLLSARQVPNATYAIAAALAVYLLTAVYNGKKIWGHYQQRLAEEAQVQAEAAGEEYAQSASSATGKER